MDTALESRPRLRLSPHQMCAAALVIVLLAYATPNLIWIWQRHVLLAEEKAVYDLVGNYACGATCDNLPPIAPAAAQFVLRLLGDPRVESVLVFYIATDSELTIEKDGETWQKPVEDIPKIRRARHLFPEAKIRACYVDENEIDSMKDFRGRDLRAMISE